MKRKTPNIPVALNLSGSTGRRVLAGTLDGWGHPKDPYAKSRTSRIV